MVDAIRDHHPTVFCVPMVEQYSPLAWSITNEVHWHHPTVRHGGVPTVVRHTRTFAYILNRPQIAEKIKEDCPRCCYIRKRTIDVEFGPISKQQLKISPTFYTVEIIIDIL